MRLVLLSPLRRRRGIANVVSFFTVIQVKRFLVLATTLLILLFFSNADADTSAATNSGKRKINFALVPKSVDNPFFDVARDGCLDQARILSSNDYEVKCLYVGPKVEDRDGTLQANMVEQLVDRSKVDGIAISVKSATAMTPVIDKAVEAGIPVITWDSDAASSKRLAYIGTNNTFFGHQLGKVVKQLRPNGGNFAIVSIETAPNIVERETGLRTELLSENKDHANKWVEAVNSPSDTQANLTLAMEQMHAFAKMNITAIVPVMGAPMRSGTWKEFVDEHRFRNLALVNGDAMLNQLQFLDRGYTHGLIGQLPYEMGADSMKVLFDLVVNQKKLEQEVFGTNVVSHIFIPLVLPELVVDHNLIGNLRYVGYILFGLITFTAWSFAMWAFCYRELRVVKVAQPNFLIMIALGVFIMSASLIPLSMDDSGNHNHYYDNYNRSVAICMSIPWLFVVGFTMTFSALYAKTRRVNILFHSQATMTRVKVTEKDVLVPFFILLACNIIVLVCWTTLNPVIYQRNDHAGTDGWNRIISTYGSCRPSSSSGSTSGGMLPYLLALGIINFSVLLMANYQAYEARYIESEFAESKYIAMAMASMLQAFITGGPIMFIVRDMPQAYYLTLAFMIFVTGLAILLLIFTPKIIFADSFAKKTVTQQREVIKESMVVSMRNRGGGDYKSVQQRDNAYSSHNSSQISSNSAQYYENSTIPKFQTSQVLESVIEKPGDENSSSHYNILHAPGSFKDEELPTASSSSNINNSTDG